MKSVLRNARTAPTDLDGNDAVMLSPLALGHLGMSGSDIRNRRGQEFKSTCLLLQRNPLMNKAIIWL